MPRSRADIAAEICARLGRGPDIQPAIEQSIDRLFKYNKSAADEWKAWAKAPKLAAKCRTDLATLRPILDWISSFRHEAYGIVEPSSLDNLDRALALIENNIGIPDPDNPKKMRQPDPRTGIVQVICAYSARSWMLEFSKIPPKRSPKNPIYWIAGLLYEVMTCSPDHPGGKHNKTGLKRACDFVLKS